VGAILTQNTNWANVEKAINNLEKNKLLSQGALFKLSHKRLASLIRPAGYYNIKAKRLKEFLAFLFKVYQGSLKKISKVDTLTLRRHLLSVNGIGPETADSILLYCLNRPVFVVDAYTKRILSRHSLLKEDSSYEEVQNLFMQNLKNDVKLFNEYHALLVKLGKDFCLKTKPKCDTCPLKINHRLHTSPVQAGRDLKKQITQIFLLVTSYWLLVINCYAAPCYGTKLPQKKEFFLGAQTHTIFKRYLEDEYGKVRSFQNFLLLSYGVYDWLSIDLKGGAGNIKQHPVGSDEVDYASNFAGGYGFRLKFYDRKNVKMVFGFQHISVHPKSRHLGDVKNKAILDDWQTSLLVSRDFKKITPYLGTRWSRIDYIHTQLDARKRKMSDLTKSYGFIYGFDLPLTEKIWINLEGSAFDSEALAFSINYSF